MNIFKAKLLSLVMVNMGLAFKNSIYPHNQVVLLFILCFLVLLPKNIYFITVKTTCNNSMTGFFASNFSGHYLCPLAFTTGVNVAIEDDPPILPQYYSKDHGA